MKRFFLISGILIIFSLSLSAQKRASMRFSEISYDFGNVEAKAGALSHVFAFENTGNDTLLIQLVRVSDPALTASCDKMRLGPGEKSALTVTFTPKNENGAIQSFVSLRSNDADFPVRQITLKAVVAAGARTFLDDFPEVIGNLRFKAKHIAFDQLKNTEIRTDTFRVYNAGKKPIAMQVKTPPPYLTWTIKPATLAPGKSGFIIVRYDTPKSGNWGLNYEPYPLTTDDSLNPDKTLSLGVNIVEDFSVLKEEQRNNPPKIEFAETTYEFGDLKQGVKVTHDFVFKNTGKADLVIHRTKPSCGCTIADPEKTVLKPGESSFIRVNYNTAGLLGEQHKSVMVISNDPATPMIVIAFTAKVQAD